MTTPTFIHLLPLTSHEMTGTKRSWEGNPVVSNNTTESDKNKDNEKSSGKMTTAMDEPSENVLSIFGTFRDELDEHHDRRERIIKASRDITALSKKMYISIFPRKIWSNANFAVSFPYSGSSPTPNPINTTNKTKASAP